MYRAIRCGQFPAARIMGRLIVPLKAIEAMEAEAAARREAVDAAEWVNDFPLDAVEHRGF